MKWIKSTIMSNVIIQKITTTAMIFRFFEKWR